MATLPILQFEDKIIETVENNPITVIIGETGSGKSTQLSQMLFRRGFAVSGVIAVTQPRRVAAVSVARRVAQEMDVRLGEEVGYAIRFEDRTSEKTKIKYVTDGVLLRESLTNSKLSDYSVVILDEAHERSLNMDILMGLVKRLVRIRGELSGFRVLITSATLEGEKVSAFFGGCPVVNVPGKLFPVEVFYTEDRPKSYVEAALKKAVDIHVNEPEGDMLIFMTGQEDIEKLVTRLEEKVRNLEEGSVMDAVIYPLHGSLPPELQISRVQANQRAGRAGRTRPGKCYRLYPSEVYLEEFMEVAVPEIQRTSLAGSVLYLKSLDLPDIDILTFDFLDPPSYELLSDALRQLYLIDAIDENGSITRAGRTMAELPLEPSLSRTLMEANDNGSLSQALTVAAMLSAETSLLPSYVKGTDKKRKHTPMNLPDGGGLGDHIQLLQIYELWDATNYDIEWCREHGLQLRGMAFVKDVRGQLCQIMQKVAKCSMEVQGSHSRRESRHKYRNLRKALSAGYANQLAERMLRHNGYKTLGIMSQLVQLHPSSVLQPDEEGMLPFYVVYHELITTSKAFMRNVCAVEREWIMPVFKKLESLDVNKLSGRISHPDVCSLEKPEDGPKKQNDDVESIDDRDSKIQAARDRFLARKVKK